MPSRSHKHFVAVPLLVASLACVAAMSSIIEAGARTLGAAPQKTIIAGDEAMDVLLPADAAGVLEPGGSMMIDPMGDRVWLLHGSLTAVADDFLRLQTGKITVDALRSGVFVISDTQSVTVAAIDAPVLVRTARREYVLPPGYQWQMRAGQDQPLRSMIPGIWLEPKLREILDIAHRRAAQSQPATEDLRTRAVDPVFSRLLALRSATDRILAPYAEDDALRQALFADDASGEWTMAFLASVRALHKPAAELYLPAWEEAAQRLITADPDAAAQQLAPLIGDLPQILDDAGYPKHASLWRQMIQRLAAFTQPQLNTASREAFAAAISQALRTNVQSSIMHDAAGAATAAVASQSMLPDIRVNESIAALKQRLLALGAMLTSESSFQPIAGQSAAIRVKTVYFATSRGDVPFTFTVNAADDTVSEISRNGVPLPNTMLLEKFVESL